MAFWTIDPWGEQRADLRNAQLIACIANMFGGRKGRTHKLTEFLLFPDDEPEPQGITDPSAIMRLFKGMARK